MKKFIIQLILLLMVGPAIGQFNVYVSGYVSDSLTGYPIPNHMVSIFSDSTNGFIYSDFAMTNSNGYYSDTVQVTVGDSGTLYALTYGCYSYPHVSEIHFSIANNSFMEDFSICNENGCQAVIWYSQYAGRLFYFQDNSTGNPNSWNWDFGDGMTSTEQYPWHQYSANGWYTVTLAIGNPSTGCNSVDYETVVANDSTEGICKADYIYSFDSTNLQYLHFFDRSLGIINSWNWNFGDPQSGTNNISSLQNPVHFFSGPGNYDVCLTIQQADSSCTDTYCQNIYVGSGGCHADFYTYPDSLDSHTIHFVDQSQGNIFQWDYSFGDGTVQTIYYPSNPNVTHTYEDTGQSYTACLYVINNTLTCADFHCDTISITSQPSCVAEFSYSSNPNTTEVTQFTDLSQAGGGGQITSWYWVFGDPGSGTGNTSTSHNPVHLFSTPGYHTVCLTISGNDTSCYDMNCKTIYVESSSPIYLHISGSVSFQNTGTPAQNHAVTWNIQNDTLTGPHTILTDNNGIYQDSILLPAGMTDGFYYVWTQDCQYLTEISSNFGPGNYTVHQNFTISCETNQLCKARISAIAAGPLGVQFDDISLGNVTSRLWNFGDGETSTVKNPAHTFASASDFQVSLTINDSITGCSNTRIKTIKFADSLLCNAFYSYEVMSNPRTVQFEDLSSGAEGYRQWNFGDGDTSTLSNPVHTYRFPGLYIAFLTIGNYSLPCWDTYTQVISISDSVTTCQSLFSYQPDPANAYAIQFYDLSTGEPESWLWNFGDNTFATDRSPLHSYPGPGSYPACLTITAGQCTSTYCMNVTVLDSSSFHQVYGQVFEGSFPLSTGMAMITSLDTTSIYAPYIATCPIDTNGVYYFTLVPDGQYQVYAVPYDNNGYLPTYFGDVLNWAEAAVLDLGEPANPYNIHLLPGTSLPEGQGSVAGQISITGLKSSYFDKIVMLLMDQYGNVISFDPVSDLGRFDFSTLEYGTYYLHAELTGITSENVQIVLSADQPHSEVHMTLSGKNILGVDDGKISAESVTIYPNPASEKVTIVIQSQATTGLSVEISDLRGHRAGTFESSLSAGICTMTIPVSHLDPGFYLLRITSGNGLNLIKKLMIVR